MATWINRIASLLVAGAYVAALLRYGGGNVFFIGLAVLGLILTWLGEKAEDYYIPVAILRFFGWVFLLVPVGLLIWLFLMYRS